MGIPKSYVTMRVKFPSLSVLFWSGKGEQHFYLVSGKQCVTSRHQCFWNVTELNSFTFLIKEKVTNTSLGFVMKRWFMYWHFEIYFVVLKLSHLKKLCYLHCLFPSKYLASGDRQCSMELNSAAQLCVLLCPFCLIFERYGGVWPLNNLSSIDKRKSWNLSAIHN